jgi:hypothetical protein
MTDAKTLHEQLIAEGILREMIAEGVVTRDGSGGARYETENWDYQVELKVFRIPKERRLVG